MSVQYISNENGKVIAVQVPIKEWEIIKSKYPDVDTIDLELPQWHKDLIDERLNDIKLKPGKIRPVSELLDELDK